jgi:uncharacterized protein (TIGR00369 family)
MSPLGETPEAALETMRRVAAGRSGFATFAGVEPVRVWDGYAELRLSARPELTQHHGHLHGAIVGMVADVACAWAAASVAGEVLTANYSVHFLAPARGDRLVGKGWVLKAGRRQVVCRSEVWAEAEDREPTLVATAVAGVSPVTA